MIIAAVSIASSYSVNDPETLPCYLQVGPWAMLLGPVVCHRVLAVPCAVLLGPVVCHWVLLLHWTRSRFIGFYTVCREAFCATQSSCCRCCCCCSLRPALYKLAVLDLFTDGERKRRQLARPVAKRVRWKHTNWVKWCEM